MSGIVQAEKYRSPKQLATDLEAIGIEMRVRAVRLALIDLRVPRIGYNALFSDFLRALRDHPDYRPFARNKRQSTRSPVTVL